MRRQRVCRGRSFLSATYEGGGKCRQCRWGTLDAISVTDYTNVKSENYSIDFDGTNWNVMGRTDAW
ncbi:hypothetical protein [Enterobacter hormaechei]|uniref:hypothetical protein n=1 Tax=Enterobacter hormaechei TaxID=158836 RepID=UPI003CC54FFE